MGTLYSLEGFYTDVHETGHPFRRTPSLRRRGTGSPSTRTGSSKPLRPRLRWSGNCGGLHYNGTKSYTGPPEVSGKVETLINEDIYDFRGLIAPPTSSHDPTSSPSGGGRRRRVDVPIVPPTPSHDPTSSPT